MSWKTEYRCVACKQTISSHSRRHNEGRCPLCGHKEPGTATIVATTEHACKDVRIPTGRPWWQFWKPTRTIKRIYKDQP